MSTLTNNRVFFLAAAAFAFGVFVRSLYSLSLVTISFIAILALVFLLVWLMRRSAVYMFAAVIFFAFTLGAARVAFMPMQLPSSFAKQLNVETTFSGTVVAAPGIRETNQRIIVSVSNGSQKTRVLAVVSLATPVSYGERVTIRGKLKTPTTFVTNYGRTFRYDRYLAVKGVFAIMQHASLTQIAPPSGFFTYMYSFIIGIKQTFLHALSRALPEPAASLAGGLVAGGTEGLGNALTNDFVRSGLIHIVVLSGYNVMIVAEAVLFALAFLSRRMAASIAILVIAAFVLAAGAGAASIRAGLMAVFALLARATGRTYDVTRALVIAVLLMLMWNPLLLAFSVGFDLSVIATLGLIFGAPLVETRLAFIKHIFLRETAAATITAQIAVLPLLLYVNGLFSLVALPANLLVLPFVPAAMAASAFAGLIGALLPTLASIAGLFAYTILSYIIWVVHTAATLPFSVFAVPEFSFAWVALAYALLAFFVYRLVKYKKSAAASAAAA